MDRTLLSIVVLDCPVDYSSLYMSTSWLVCSSLSASTASCHEFWEKPNFCTLQTPAGIDMHGENSVALDHSQTICFVFNLTNSEITNKISAETVVTVKRGVFSWCSEFNWKLRSRKSYGSYAGACNINSAMYIFRDSGFSGLRAIKKPERLLIWRTIQLFFVAVSTAC